jgi:AraC family transcriptional regulator
MTYSKEVYISGRIVDVGGFNIKEFFFAADSNGPRHFHDDTAIALNLSGLLRETFNKREYDCAPGSALVIPQGEAHADYSGKDACHYLCIYIKHSVFEPLNLHPAALRRILFSSNENISALAKRIYSELNNSDTAARLVMHGLLFEMIGEIIRDDAGRMEKKPPRFISSALDYVHQHFIEALNLSDLASLVGVHPTHLARSFKQHYGYSLGEYVRRRRVEYASRQLIASDKPLAEIANEVGFYDQSHFTLVFKQHMKITPAQYRRELQPHNSRR